MQEQSILLMERISIRSTSSKKERYEKKKHYSRIWHILWPDDHNSFVGGFDPFVFAGCICGKTFTNGILIYGNQTEGAVRVFCKYINRICCICGKCYHGTDPGLGAGKI